MNNKKFISISLFAYAFLIIFISHLQMNDSGQGFIKINDKVLHMSEYFILGILSVRYIMVVLGKKPAQSYFLTFVCCALFAVTDEIHQGFVGYFDSGIFGGIRNPDLFDFFADSSGIAVSLFVIYFYRNSRKNSKYIREQND
ncbi:MAG TPA: VanZ family protein [Clostridiales bacterium]|nr:VanZ family protein [Clostridiales bacterium]